MRHMLNRDFIELLVDNIEVSEETQERHRRILGLLYSECPEVANQVEVFIDQYVTEMTDLALTLGWLAREDPTKYLLKQLEE